MKVRDPEVVPALPTSVRRLNGIDNVVYGAAVVARLLELGSVLRRVGIAVIAVFFVVAGIIISNTIRLTVFARRREIAIMQLVGATNTYIRLPFICEALLDGFIGARSPSRLLAVARATLWPRLLEALPWAQLAVSRRRSPPCSPAELLVVGAAIGIVASGSRSAATCARDLDDAAVRRAARCRRAAPRHQRRVDASKSASRAAAR